MTIAADIELSGAYASLPDRFYAPLPPAPVREPRLIRFNEALALELGLELNSDATDLADVFSGNLLPKTSIPIATAYAGHQFGGFSPQLGDGRAILLGEITRPDGQLMDMQLKGSGRTPFSRGGDGRAWLGPVLREYLVSEAMAALGIPTTRALAAVSTGEDVLRDEILPGAVLTRVATSHIRVGTFQFFAVREDKEGLETLLDFAIERHDPELSRRHDRALAFLSRVVERQARLVAKWMGVGFIHGVMNTDNCAVSGETIDYGPCAFMDHYNSAQVYSSIDRQGRYAYSNQPRLAHWNLAQFASALLPLIDGDEEKAVAAATEAIDQFVPLYSDAWEQVFSAKIGVKDTQLAQEFLKAMEADGADFTNSFRSLSRLLKAGDFGTENPHLNSWLGAWRAVNGQVSQSELDQVNPAVIPRNHLIERLIVAARGGDFALFEEALDVLKQPFEAPDRAHYLVPPQPNEVVQATFCGT